MPQIPRKERTHYTLAERNAYGLRIATEKAYCQSRGLIPVEHYEWSCACAHLLLRQDHPPGGAGVPDPGCTPPYDQDRWWDHVSVYARIADGRNVIVSQPYCPPKDYAAVEQLVKSFCDKWGLNYMISNEWSWHRPGRTLLIELSPPPPQSRPKAEVR
jgi:hypothetical protein